MEFLLLMVARQMFLLAIHALLKKVYVHPAALAVCTGKTQFFRVMRSKCTEAVSYHERSSSGAN